MSRILSFTLMAVLVILFADLNAAEEGANMKMAENIIWLGHDGFLIKGENV